MFSDATILVAGANLSDREAILQALGDDCHVMAAQTVEAALAHAAQPVALVICEIKSNELNGLELMRRWKLRQPQTPFVMLAEKHDIGAAVDAMKSGATDCLVKPIDSDELRTATVEHARTADVRSRPGSDGDSSGGSRRKPALEIPPDTSLEDLERAAVEQALVQHHGNRTHAARTLGISVRTLQRKLKAWGMPILAISHPAMSHSYMVTGEMDSPSIFGAHVH